MRKLLICSAVLVLSACVSDSAYVPAVDFGVGYEMQSRIIGDKGYTGIIRFQQPVVPGKAFLGYTHVSELGHDRGTLDQFEFYVRMPLALER